MHRRPFAALVLLVAACPPPQQPPPPEVAVRPAGEAQRWFDADIDAPDALSLVGFLDARFREPGNGPYRESLDEIETRLEDAGFGADERLFVSGPSRDAPTWEPSPPRSMWSRRGRTAALRPERSVAHHAAHRFAGHLGPHRGRPSRGRGGRSQGSRRARPGPAGTRVRPLRRRAGPRRAVHRRRAVRGTGRGRRGRPVRRGRGAGMGTGCAAALAHGRAPLARAARGGGTGRSARRSIGARRAVPDRDAARGDPLRAAAGLVFAAHLDEPGAEDNASGVAVAVALARLFARGIRDGGAPAPNRSPAFRRRP